MSDVKTLLIWASDHYHLLHDDGSVLAFGENYTAVKPGENGPLRIYIAVPASQLTPKVFEALQEAINETTEKDEKVWY